MMCSSFASGASARTLSPVRVSVNVSRVLVSPFCVIENAGTGALLIQELQTRAAAAKRPLRTQVIRFNRAVNLLERLGFRRTSETGSHFQMEWLPGGVGSPANRGPNAAVTRGVVDTEG